MNQIFNEIMTITIKSITAVIVLFALTRLMGKKQISQLTPFDYIVGISIGSIAGDMSVDKQISIFDGVTSMITWAIFPVLISFVSVHSIIVRRMLDGVPTILIQNGKIIEKSLKKTKLTVNDLLEELRGKDVFNIVDVDCAILETSGKLSVLLKASRQAITAADMNLSPQNQNICANIIIDGKMMKENMKQMNINETWLNNELGKNNIGSASEVMLATCDANHILHVDRKKADPDDLTILQ